MTILGAPVECTKRYSHKVGARSEIVTLLNANSISDNQKHLNRNRHRLTVTAREWIESDLIGSDLEQIKFAAINYLATMISRRIIKSKLLIHGCSRIAEGGNFNKSSSKLTLLSITITDISARIVDTTPECPFLSNKFTFFKVICQRMNECDCVWVNPLTNAAWHLFIGLNETCPSNLGS